MDYIPDDCELNSKVLVSYNIAKFCNIGPINFRTKGKGFRWDILDCFADDFEIPGNRVDALIVLRK